jgi:copper chaperone
LLAPLFLFFYIFSPPSSLIPKAQGLIIPMLPTLGETMIELTIPDMSCGHCASSIANICSLVDPRSKVEVDLKAKTVKIDSAQDRSAFILPLSEAGYPPLPL